VTRAVPPTVREKARSRTCPNCRAAPGEKCTPDRAGRSQLHRGRIRDAEQAMEVPPYRILPPDADRHCMELDPDCADTLGVSLHKDVVRELARSHYEAAVLLWLLLEQVGADRSEKLMIKNPRGVRINPLAACVIERRELSAQLRMEWNAAKASWAGAPLPTPEPAAAQP
jgi:hypothetical protein